MNYVFIKRYNPAYDFFLIRYFKEGGIDAGEKLSWKRADYKQLLLQEKSDLTPHEKLFLSYIRSWRDHPESRPSLHNLFEKMLSSSGTDEVKKLMQLQSELPSGKGKLLFSEREVAADISNFYIRYIATPLRKEMEEGVKGRKLAKFFIHEEHDHILKFRPSPERMDEESSRVAKELLARLGRTSTQRVLGDLSQILTAHFNSPEHMKPYKYLPPNDLKKVRRCEHKSELLSLNVYQELEDDDVTGILAPIRGFGQIEEGWQEVLFPRYYVKASR